jgi:hypothetical protein
MDQSFASHTSVIMSTMTLFQIMILKKTYFNASTFCRARHKELCSEIQGKVMLCSICQKIISASDIVNQSLQQFKEHLIPGDQSQDKRPDTIIPLSKQRLDMAAYTFFNHMENRCAKENNPFWGNVNVLENSCSNIDLKTILFV